MKNSRSACVVSAVIDFSKSSFDFYIYDTQISLKYERNT